MAVASEPAQIAVASGQASEISNPDFGLSSSDLDRDIRLTIKHHLSLPRPRQPDVAKSSSYPVMKSAGEIRAIVDAHEQRYFLSCSPSLVELILKIEGRVAPDYYELQDKYKNENIGLGVFAGQTIKGFTFHKHDTSKQGTFAERINAEWKRQQLFAAHTLNAGSTTHYHGWIVADVTDDTVALVSKYSECGNGEGKKTATSTLHISEAFPPTLTDLLFYEPARSMA